MHASFRLVLAATMFLVLRHGRHSVRYPDPMTLSSDDIAAEKSANAKSAACPYFDRQPDQKPAQTAPFGGTVIHVFFKHCLDYRLDDHGKIYIGDQ